jgi:hypothetical protein
MCWLNVLAPHDDTRPDSLVALHLNWLIDIDNYILHRIDRVVGTSRPNLTRYSYSIFPGVSTTLRL